jgi:predicted small lipoprotein YifL
MKRFVVLLMLLALASCGKREPPPHLRLYGPASGHDSNAWSNPPFNGDKTTWRLHEKERAQREAEYGER